MSDRSIKKAPLRGLLKQLVNTANPAISNEIVRRFAALEQERDNYIDGLRHELKESDRLRAVIQNAADTANAGDPAGGWGILYAELVGGKDE